ncbi:MAG: hypothetical protein WA421_12770, partial [Nitrososphaeraceae archaeon]
KKGNLIPRDKILALKVIRECNEAKFVLFKEGPSMMNVQILQERLEQIEDRQQQLQEEQTKEVSGSR